MTSIDKADRVSDQDAARSKRGDLSREFAETVRLAAPMALTQLSQLAMMTTDLAFIGRLGSEAVAAAALAGTVYWVSFTFGMGLMSAVAPLAAQAFGAGEASLVRRSLRTGLWAALLIALPIMLFSLRGEQILLSLGQATVPAHLAQQYLFGLAWGVAPALWFIAIRGFMGAVNRPEPVLWIMLAAIPANALLVYPLLYGEWGLPRLGLFGAGLATTSVNFATVLAGMWFAVHREPFTDYRVLTRFWDESRRPPSPRIRSRSRSPRSCSWSPTASGLPQPCASGTRSAATIQPASGAPVSSRCCSGSRSAPS